jgi:hypothetical protein
MYVLKLLRQLSPSLPEEKEGEEEEEEEEEEVGIG